MSYNTRRTTPATPAGRGSGTTQVNYHQQPTRTAATQQRAAQGYTTQNYTASQPAFTTQPPLPKSTPSAAINAAAAAAATPAAKPAAPVVAQQAKAPATPPVKAEPITPAGTPTATPAPAVKPENGQGEEGSKFPWKKRPFVKVPNKVKRARMNAKLRRALNPKNAITFLNELRPGNVKFTVSEAPGWGYTATTEIDGNTYSGHALSIAKAKMMASEQALKSVMLEQISKAPAPKAEDAKEGDSAANTKAEEAMETEQSEEGEPKAKKGRFDEDEIPWGSLAAFALHKLFTEWHRESGEPVENERFDEDVTDELFTRRPGPVPFGYPPMRYPGPPFAPRGRAFGRGFPPRGAAAGFRRPPMAPAHNFLQGSRPAGGPNNQLPMKKIPDDANQRHPVMLLNQLNPNLTYREEKEGALPNVIFKVFVNIDGKDYEGRGKNKKDAKKEAAKAALAPLGIIYQGE